MLGIVRYANAKADFNGLIEALKINLIEGHDLTTSPGFSDKISRLRPKKSVAFTSFVTHADCEVPTQAPEGLLPGLYLA